MEKDKKGDEKEKVEACPCCDTSKRSEWSYDQWKIHWFNMGIRQEITLEGSYEKGYLKRLERLHKESRG
jgi:hypothetical protein